MSNDGFKQSAAAHDQVLAIEDEYVPVELVEEEAPPGPALPPVPDSRWWSRPLLLFLATCATTFFAGSYGYSLPWGALQYSAAIMTILVCHEAGHFLQALRYGVPASLPFFIPLPLPPVGTMGAVIAMSSKTPNRRAPFDIGITGPLAGLVPTLIFCVWGLHLSSVVAARADLGDPLLFQFLVPWLKGPLPPGHEVHLHPLAMAGWVGLLITSLNLFPIGQLDGGHVLYALLKRKANFVAIGVLGAAIAGVIAYHLLNWSLMLALLLYMGPRHPPTCDDETPLGLGRVVLGWLTLAFLVLGFCPNPFPQ